MSNLKSYHWSRREFLSTAALAGTGALLGLRSEAIAAEPPPETTKVRLIRSPDICLAPLYMAEELLRAEGFTDVQFVQGTGGQDDVKLAATGATDFIGGFVGRHLAGLDAGDPIVILSGLHIGCFELFGNQRVRPRGFCRCAVCRRFHGCPGTGAPAKRSLSEWSERARLEGVEGWHGAEHGRSATSRENR